MSVKIFSEHALLQTKIATLRNVNTPHPEFVRTMQDVSTILCALVSAEITTTKMSVKTPLTRTHGVKVEYHVVLVPILRAGLGMLEGFQSLLPTASVGHVGVERDHKTLKPKFYYYKVPTLRGAEVWVIDPMLATGGSLDFALTKIKDAKPRIIRAVSVLASPEGIAFVQKNHPDVHFYTAVLDTKLNNKGYIVPGLGDAGDRYFNT
ncbi:MAG TPA: uracil phosphoribosyltransferase [Turneriella sp.]|nr:uracil phosphoribosyltransferase [Turneriella sp.]